MVSESTALFSENFERSVDTKRRVSVPAAWLTQGDGGTFHVIPHPTEGYLMVMPPGEFEMWEQRIQESNLSPVNKRMAVRKFYSDAHAVTTDKQGRILLTENHCARAGIRNEAVFVGARSRFEIWSPERFHLMDEANTAALQAAAEAIGL